MKIYSSYVSANPLVIYGNNSYILNARPKFLTDLCQSSVIICSRSFAFSTLSPYKNPRIALAAAESALIAFPERRSQSLL